MGSKENDFYFTEEEMAVRGIEGNVHDRAAEMGLYDEFEERPSRRRGHQDDYGRRSKPPKQKRNKKKTALVVVLCLLAVFLLGYLLVHQFLVSKFDKTNQVQVKSEDWDIDPRVAEELKDYKSIALLGTDARADDNEEECRSDAIIIFTINTKTDKVTMTSVMRDSYLDVEAYGHHFLDKITHAHFYEGPVATVRALNRNYDLNIDAFIRVNWGSVAQVVDAMGGIEVDVSDDEMYEMNNIIPNTAKNIGNEGNLITQTGLQTLDGVQAVTYCRIRKLDGDEARGGRMRKVIAATIDKAKTMKISELNDVTDLGLSKVTTSMDGSELVDIVMNGLSYDMDGSFSMPLNYEFAMIDGVSYVVDSTLRQDVIALHKKLFGQKDYQPTDRVLIINERIKTDSGYTNGEETDYDLLQRYTDEFTNGKGWSNGRLMTQEEYLEEQNNTTNDGGN